MVEMCYKGHEVRTVMIDGEPWWVAADVCKVLELSNPSVAISCLWEDEKAKFNLGYGQPANIVNESGLYSLILNSRKKEALQFKRWITHEVLPTIRKTGGVYMTQEKAEELLADPDLIIGLAQQVKELMSFSVEI